MNIVTFDGAITVRGWDKPQVMYTATKRGGDEQELKQIVYSNGTARLIDFDHCEV